MRVDHETTIPFQGDRGAAVQRAAEVFQRYNFEVTMNRAGDAFEAVNTRSMFSGKKTAFMGITRATITTLGNSLQVQAEFVDLSRIFFLIGLMSVCLTIGMGVLFYFLFWKTQPYMMLVLLVMLVDLPVLVLAPKLQQMKVRKMLENTLRRELRLQGQ